MFLFWNISLGLSLVLCYFSFEPCFYESNLSVVISCVQKVVLFPTPVWKPGWINIYGKLVYWDPQVTFHFTQNSIRSWTNWVQLPKTIKSGLKFAKSKQWLKNVSTFSFTYLWGFNKTIWGFNKIPLIFQTKASIQHTQRK